MSKIVPHNKFPNLARGYTQKTIGFHKSQISTRKLNFKANKLFIDYSFLAFTVPLNVYSPFVNILYHTESLFDRNKNAFC